MATVLDYLEELDDQRDLLAAHLTARGVPADTSEKFNSLVAKVLEVASTGTPTVGAIEPELYGTSGEVGAVEPVCTNITKMHTWEQGTMATASNTWLESTTRLTAKTAQPIEGMHLTLFATDKSGIALDFAPHFNDADGNFLANPSWTAAGTMIIIPAGAVSIYICLRRPDDSEIAPDDLASVVLREVK